MYIERSFLDVNNSINNKGIPLIITATDIETKEVHEVMQPIVGNDGIIKFYSGDYTYYYGLLGNYEVIHIQSEMGSQGRSSSLMTTIESLRIINPKFVLMVGIAFGVDCEKQKVGDVLVSESIIPYDSKKIGIDEEVPRGKQANSNKYLLNRFRNIKDWEFDLCDNNLAKIYYTNLLSGEVLIDNEEFRNKLLKVYPTSMGGEMEGAGIFAACDNKVPWIIVKAICDFANGKKGLNKEKNQKLAIKSAVNLCMRLFDSEFAFEELSVFPIKKKSTYLPFEEAKKIAKNYMNKQGKNLKKQDDWKRYCLSLKKEDGVPKNPDEVYKENGWISWNDWFSNTDKKILNFNDAKEFVHTLGLKSEEEWLGYCNGKWPSLPVKPNNIPDNPQSRYWRDWKSWSVWLMNEDRWLSFREARKFVRKLELKGQQEWRKYVSGELKGYQPKPINIPSTPDIIYQKEWINISNWLGYEGKIKPRKGDKLEDNWWSYEDAKNFVHRLKLKNSTEWNKYVNGEFESLIPRPKDGIPKSPYITYRKYNCWISWNDFLGESYKKE